MAEVVEADKSGRIIIPKSLRRELEIKDIQYIQSAHARACVVDGIWLMKFRRLRGLEES